MDTPIIETERLILRPFRAEDAQAVFSGWETDPDVARYMFWKSHNDIEKTREWLKFELGQIAADDWFRWAIVLKASNTLIGTGLIYLEEQYGCFEIGYNLAKAHWGKGYITEAMSAVCDFAKDELRLDKIMGRCAKENPASANVMKKLGFKFQKNIPYYAAEDTVLYEGEEYMLTF